jgi:hypothetical protein
MAKGRVSKLVMEIRTIVDEWAEEDHIDHKKSSEAMNNIVKAFITDNRRKSK